MFRVLDYVSDDLPPTRTYGRRSFCWLPVDETHPAYDGRLGSLIIKLQHARSGVHRAIEVDRYAVERDTPEPGDNGGAAFWLLNELDKDAAEPYRCVVGGMTPKCGCKAGQCKVPGEPDITEGCKHRDCILWLIQNGFI